MVEFLNKNYPQNEDVRLYVLDGYDCIEGPDGEVGFGVYVSNKKEIYIAADVPEPEITMQETIAHEYRHFMQECMGVSFDEEDAEKFAKQVLNESVIDDLEDYGSLFPRDKYYAIVWAISAIAKLAEYEEIGLSPEQIRQMDELYSEIAKENAMLKKAGEGCAEHKN